MPTSKNPATYTDCHQVLETAVAKGGLKLAFESKGKAINFRLRCNAYRKLLHEIEARGKPEGFVTSTPYDIFNFSQESNLLIIKPRAIQGAQIMDLDGESVELEPISNIEDMELMPEDNDLLEDAHDIAADILRTGRVDLE